MPRKPIITAAIAASLATTANATAERPVELDEGDIIATTSVADDVLIHEVSEDELGDLIGPWEPPHDLTNAADYDYDYLAQTVYAGPGEDGVFRAPNARIKKPGKGITLDNGIKKPGKGITLDNGIKKPGKLRKSKRLKKN